MIRLVALDHVQLAMPAGRESEAEDFYGRLLGMEVIPKPEPLASRGGRWFASRSATGSSSSMPQDGNRTPRRGRGGHRPPLPRL